MNNLLLIIGMIALSNGNISLFDNKNKSKKSSSQSSNKRTTNRERKGQRERKNKSPLGGLEDILNFNTNDITKGLKLMDLSEEDLERGMEIITRTKKYMSKDERKLLIKVESLLDLVRGIKKLSSIEAGDLSDETSFFRSMDDEDKKNMMIREILEVFPEKRKESVEKAIDMKKKIDIFAELFLPDDFGEGGFSLSSLANINNLGSMSNLKLLGSLLMGDDSQDNDEEYEDDEYEYYEEYEEYDEYEDYEE